MKQGPVKAHPAAAGQQVKDVLPDADLALKASADAAAVEGGPGSKILFKPSLR